MADDKDDVMNSKEWARSCLDEYPDPAANYAAWKQQTSDKWWYRPMHTVECNPQVRSEADVRGFCSIVV